MKKYYMVTDQDDIIWGVGKSRTQAQSNARKNLKKWHYIIINLGRSIECNETIYEMVKVNGCADKNDTWHLKERLPY